MARGGATPNDGLVGSRIRQLRHARGLTQRDLADALGITFQQIQKYERGTNRVAATSLPAMAGRLGCSVAYLLGAAEGGDQVPPPASAIEADAVEMLDVYARIRSAEGRRALVLLARALSDAPRDVDGGEV